jgi:hypothetical protein
LYAGFGGRSDTPRPLTADFVEIGMEKFNGFVLLVCPVFKANMKIDKM